MTTEKYAAEIAEEGKQRARLHDLAEAIAEECPGLWKGYPDVLGEPAVSEVLQAFRRRGMTTPERPAKPSKLRRLSTTECLAVFDRDGYRCLHCGTRRRLTVDHIHPVSRGGTNDMSNLQTLCASCNSRKGERISVEDQARPRA